MKAKTNTVSKPQSAQHTEANAEQRSVLDAVVSLANKATTEDDRALSLSLQRYGQLVPILRQGGVVVDGRRRQAALTQLGKDPWVVDLDAASGTHSEPDHATTLGRSFLEVNGCRRELPLIVRAAIADALATLRKGDNQHGEGGMSREEAARSVGVSADTLDRYRTIKNDSAVYAKAISGEMSLPQAVRVVRAKDLAERAKSLTSSDSDIVASLEGMGRASAKVNVLYADVPTDYGCPGSASSVAPGNHYPTMSWEAIQALPVAEIAAKDAVLWFWTPNSCIEEALATIHAWGFNYVTSMVWIKPSGVVSPGAVRPHHETLLVAKRGAGLTHADQQAPSYYQSPALSRRHSEKPKWFAKQLERLYPDSAKLELFARRTRPGWITLGNQIVIGQVAVPGTVASNDDPTLPSADQTKPATTSALPTEHKSGRLPAVRTARQSVTNAPRRSARR
jgi:N6-adenosine-specific RNA methylase IME4